jgi:signal transduction histidine kinase/ActR/RegA family two-component response regulator
MKSPSSHGQSQPHAAAEPAGPSPAPARLNTRFRVHDTSGFSKWIVGTAAAATALMGQAALQTWLGIDALWPLAYLATLAAARYGGFVTGTVVTILCALWSLWMTAASSAAGPTAQLMAQLALFVPFGLLVSAVCQSLHNARQQLRQGASSWAIGEQRTGAALAAAGVNTFELDAQLRFTSIKGPYCGFEPSEVIGRAHDDLLSRHQAVAINAAHRLVLEAGKRLHREFHVTVRGEPLLLDYLILPITDDNKHTIGLTTVIVDMTERQHMGLGAAAPQPPGKLSPQWLAEQSDEFLSNLSHELRTPLNALSGWSHILSRNEIDDALRHRAAEAIARSVQAQKALIDDFLDLGRWASGRLSVNLQECELADILERTVASVQNAAKAKWIEVISNCITPCAQIYADPTRLEQVFYNVLTNAIKFSPMGGVVEIRVNHGNEQIHVEIIDSGQGISAEELPHVFAHTPAAAGITKRRHGGLGMGLKMAKALVELHQGNISIKSQGLGTGTTVRLSLPKRPSAVREETRTSPVPAASDVLAPDGLTWCRILLVDNDEDSLEVAAITLRERGALVRAFDDPLDAKVAACNATFDLIISDIGMPLMDGFELLKQLRAAGVAVPAIALTAFTGEDIRSRALEAGYMSVLVKPLAPPRLVEAVADALTRSNQRHRAGAG